MTNISIKPIARDEKPQFTKIMYDAFKSDPLFISAFGKPEQNKPTASKFLNAMFDMNIQLGNHPIGLYNDQKLIGCMLLERPMKNKFENFWRMSKSLITLIPTMLNMGGETAKFLNDYMNLTRKSAPKQPHHYLSMIGILSTEQGKGLGRKLMQHAIKSSNQDPTSTGIALDTENQSNTAIYEKWKFHLTQQLKVNQMTVYCMFRSVDNMP